MKKLFILILIGITGFTYGQDTETRSVGAFTGIKASEGVSVYLKKGDKETVKVEVTGTDASNVITEVSGSYLKIHMREGRYRNANAKVYVTYVKVDRLSASSAANIYSESSIKSDRLEVSASSAGTIELTVDVNSMEASASSAGDVELKGKTKSLLAEASSAGEVDTYDVEAEDVDVQASSGGSAKVTVTGSLRANASSGGSVRYRGNPDKQITNSSSGGSVKKSN